MTDRLVDVKEMASILGVPVSWILKPMDKCCLKHFTFQEFELKEPERYEEMVKDADKLLADLLMRHYFQLAA